MFLLSLSGCFYISPLEHASRLGDSAPHSDTDGDADADADADTDADTDADADTDTGPIDADADGYSPPSDCDDTDPNVHPGVDDPCNGVDDDCDSSTDEDPDTAWYTDADGDGYGDAGSEVLSCTNPGGMIATGGDCDDTSTAASPAKRETCSTAFDDNCDGEENEDGATGCAPVYADNDGDGFGSTTSSCVCDPAGTPQGDPLDCDDTESSAYVGAAESCGNGVDEDCNGLAADCGAEGVIAIGSAKSMTLTESRATYLADTVASAGDINGDGHRDYTMSAWNNSDVGERNGASWLFFGPASGSRSTSSADLVFYGDDWDAVGWSAGAGDATGDGTDDLWIGAGGAYTAYLFEGPITSSVTAADAYGSVYGYPDSIGWEGEVNVDVNGDGAPDALFDARSDVVHGFLGPFGSGSQTTASESFSITGESGDYLGMFMSADGDYDGDGVDDLAVSASGRADGGWGAGMAVLFLGPITSDLTTGGADLEVPGDYEYEGVGYSLAIVPDTDGDGTDDLLVGVSGWLNDYSLYASSAGGAALFAGGRTGSIGVEDADAMLVGEMGSYAYGACAAGDVDGDGKGDVVVGGAGWTNSSGEMAGRAYVATGPFTGSIDLAGAWAIIDGPSDYAGFGAVVANLGDEDADGVNEVFFGAPYSDPNTTYLVDLADL